LGLASIRKSLTLLQGVLQRAFEWGRIPANPVAAVRKPPACRARAVVPLPPELIEAMRAWLLRRALVRDATLISVLAYAGLRPGEALALTWAHVRQRTLLVEGAVSFGAIEGTKTGRRRTVPLLAPLGQDLAEWRLRAGRPAAATLVSQVTTAARGRSPPTRTGADGSTPRPLRRRVSSARGRTICATRSCHC
jgi:integrase